MLTRALATDTSRTLFAQRLVLGLVMLPHGLQKTLGLFGGYGFHQTLGFFTDTMHVPAPLAVLVILSESLGSLALLLGFGTRLAAFGASAVMFGAIAMSHWSNGFFMNWFGNQPGEGFEYHLLALALSIPLVVRGAGAWSVDRWLAARTEGWSASHGHAATARA